MLYSVCAHVSAAFPAGSGGGPERLLEEHHRTRQTFGKVLYTHQREDTRARNPRNRRKRRVSWGSAIRVMLSSPGAGAAGSTRRCAPRWPSVSGSCATTVGPWFFVRRRG